MELFCGLKLKKSNVFTCVVCLLLVLKLYAADPVDVTALDEMAYSNPEQLLKKFEARRDLLSANPLKHRMLVIKAKALYYSNQFAESQTNLIAVEADFNVIRDNNIKELTMRFMGQNFYRMGALDQAMNYALKAKLIADEYGLVAAKAQITNMIAAIHLRSGEHELAKQYFIEALSSFKDIDAKNDVAKVTNNLAAVYIELEEFEPAKEYLSRALDLAEELNRPTTFMSAIVNQIELQMKMEQFEAAQKSYQKCLGYAETENLRSYQVWCLEAGVDLLQSQGEFNQAISVAEQAYGMAKTQQLSQSQINVGKVLINLYKLTEQYEKALQVSAENLTLVEAVKAEIISLKLEEVKALNEVEQTQQQLKFERQQNKLNQSNQRLTTVGLMILIPILLVALYLLRSKKQVLKELSTQQQQTEDALDAMRIAKETNEELAKTDALTGLYNRREMLNVLNQCFQQNSHDMHVMMLDVDWFKRINDTYGHVVGDQVLNALSDKFRAWLPEKSYCSRWGGEEFLVLFKSLSLAQVEHLGREFLKQVTTIKIENHPELSISVSAGLCNFRNGLSIDQWINLADEALYTSKSNGKNQLTVSA